MKMVAMTTKGKMNEQTRRIANKPTAAEFRTLQLPVQRRRKLNQALTQMMMGTTMMMTPTTATILIRTTHTVATKTTRTIITRTWILMKVLITPESMTTLLERRRNGPPRRPS